MKKIIVAALALATSGFCIYAPTLPVDQVSMLQGCEDDAGTTAAAIATATNTGNGSTQFIVTSKDPLFGSIVEMAKNSVLTGKKVIIDYPSINLPNASKVYKYQYTDGTGKVSCFTQGFNAITNFTLRRY